MGCPETSVHNYQSTLLNIPEERISQQRKVFQTEHLDLNGLCPLLYTNI